MSVPVYDGVCRCGHEYDEHFEGGRCLALDDDSAAPCDCLVFDPVDDDLDLCAQVVVNDLVEANWAPQPWVGMRYRIEITHPFPRHGYR